MERKRENLPRVNFRPLLFAALGLSFGVFLYGRIRFGGLIPSDFLLIAVFLFFAFRPISLRRAALLLLLIFGSALVGAGSLHLYAQRFGFLPAGEYEVSGTVLSVSYKGGYSYAVLSSLELDGKAVGGKCRVYLPTEEVCPSDELTFSAALEPTEASESYYFSQNIRFTASASSFERTGKSKNPFLRLNEKLFRTLNGALGKEEAGLGYALLTGNSGSMEESLLNSARRGGIAHIFAVSGLHIGILYGAVSAVFGKLKRYRFLPALLFAGLYCAFCNFTISSVRALIMCGALALRRASGEKYDFLEAISLAAILALLFSPAQWFSVGFRLSFGACLGLALFSGSFSRLFKRLKFPKGLCAYLSAAISVQLFLFPIQIEAFGYFSAFGALLNLLLLPALPALFLPLFVGAALSLLLPPLTGLFLAIPGGLISVFISLLSVPLPVLEGFSLGAGGTVWLLGCFLLSERFRMAPKGRALTACLLAGVLAIAVTLENAVFYGCRIESAEGVALIRTRETAVLVLDDEVSPQACREFLQKRYGGRLDAAIVLAEDEVRAINTAALLDIGRIRAYEEVETGLRETEVLFGEKFSCSGLEFSYLGYEKLLLSVEELAVEIDFTGRAALGADLFVGGAQEGLKYFLDHGIIRAV